MSPGFTTAKTPEEACNAYACGGGRLHPYCSGDPLCYHTAEVAAASVPEVVCDLYFHPGGSPGGIYVETWNFFQEVGCPIGYAFQGSISGGDYYCQPTGIVPDKNKKECPATGGTNPINLGTGNKFQIETDYAGVPPSPLRFQRFYNSSPGAFVGTIVTQPPQIGARWTHTYSSVVALASVPSFQTAVVMRPKGGAIYFRAGPGNTWTSDADDVDGRLERLLDAGGQPVGWRFTDCSGSIEEFDVSGKLLRVQDAAGAISTVTYSDSSTPTSIAPYPGLMIKVTDPSGRSLNFKVDSRKQITELTTPDGDVYQYTYEPPGYWGALLGVTGPNQKIRDYLYEGIDRQLLTGIIDENADRSSPTYRTDASTPRFATFAYDSSSRAILSKHAGDVAKYTIAYNAGNATITDPLLTTRTNNFSPVLGVAAYGGASLPCATCSRGLVASATTDAQGNATSTTDFSGKKACFKFDLARNLEIARVEGLPGGQDCTAPLTDGFSLTAPSRRITTEWHAGWKLPKRVAEPLRITTNAYHGEAGISCAPPTASTALLCFKTIQATTDPNGSLAFGASPQGASRVTTYTYNVQGNALTVDGPRTDVNDTTAFAYYTTDDPSGNYRAGDLASVTNALAQITSFTQYDGAGRMKRMVDPNGLETLLEYWPRGRLKSRKVGSASAGYETTSYEYDAVGQLTRVALPDSSALEYQYDLAHRLTEIRLKDSANALAGKTVYTLDLMGNRTQESIKDAADVVLQTRGREYNALNRLIKDIGGTNPTAQVTQYGYDNQGNLTSRDGPLSGTTDAFTYTYDALNRLATQIDPSGAVGGTTVYGYNGLDQLVSVTDPRTLVTSYSYDGLSNLNSQTSPDAGNTVNTFDAAGNISTSTDAKSQVTSYTYDSLNRVTSITYHGGVLHTYQYDQGTNGVGRLTTVIEPNSTTQYGYNQKGRLATETRTISGVAYVTGYAYDAFGRLTGMTYPGGRTVTYTLDSLGRASQITTTKNSTTQTVVNSVAYRPFGPMRSFTFGNGQAYTRAFDLDGRVSSYTLGNQSFPITVGFDDAGRITLVTDTGTGNTRTFGYDALDRLMSSAGTAVVSQSFTYDAVGNRATKTVGAVADTYSYFVNSNRLNFITGANPRTYTHDSNGSITTDTVNSFTYDTRGRLTQSTSAIGTTTYQVNSLGQRVRKTNLQGDTVFHYDTGGRLIAETSPSGQVRKEYFYLGDVPVGVIQ